MVLLDLAAAGSSLDQLKIAAIPAISAIEQRARASIPAEIVARGLSCVSATLQLKREWSLWPEFCWIPGNLCEFSKGYFAPTFLSSSPPTLGSLWTMSSLQEHAHRAGQDRCRV